MKTFKLPDEIWKATEILPTRFYQSLGPPIFETTKGEKIEIIYVSPTKQLLDIFDTHLEPDGLKVRVTEFLLDGTLNFIVKYRKS